MLYIIAIVIIIMCAYIMRPVNKEKYMDTLKGMNKTPYMGIMAITNNPGDLVVCALFVLSVVGYVLYRAYMEHRARTNRRACMKRAMVDYSYSSYLVRMLEEKN